MISPSPLNGPEFTAPLGVTKQATGLFSHTFFTTSGTYCIWIRGLDESGFGGGDSNFWGVDGSYVGAMTQSARSLVW